MKTLVKLLILMVSIQGVISKRRSRGFFIRGGPSPNEGNVFFNGKPICDDHWDDIAAGVFCRTLGYQDGTATMGSKYGQVSSDFSMDDVRCNGDETSLLDCGHVTRDNCGSHEGAGVICSGFFIRGGPSPNEGNIFYNGKPICDDHWDDIDAGVFCRTLGYQDGTATKFSKYGQVSSDFSMDDVRCNGDEASLLDCGHVTRHNCGSQEGAGVICSDSTCKCGVKKHGTRIVGGSASQVNEYPWMVLLSMVCGGSVIGDRWVLTAAHCFYRNGVQGITDPAAVTITLGEHDKSITSETLLTKTVTPDKIIIHESFDPFSKYINDLALLRLPSAIDLNIYTPVCLPAQGEDYTDQNVWVYGWGSLSEGGFTTAILQELEITVVDDSVAQPKFSLTDAQLGVMVFAGGEEGKDACQGDSGGPLSYDNNGQHELVGVTSWGLGCAREGFPGVYTEISAFRNWIDDKIGDADTC